jgi:hypothetical protein
VKVDLSRLSEVDKENVMPPQNKTDKNVEEASKENAMQPQDETDKSAEEASNENVMPPQAETEKSAEEAGKENIMPPHETDTSAEEGERLKEENLRVEQEAGEVRKSPKPAARAAAKLLKAAEHRKEADEKRLRREAEEERARHEAHEALLRQEAELERSSKLLGEIQAAQRKVGPWCKAHGYEDVLNPKTTLRGNKKYALHTAVKHEDCDAVKMLLLCGAQKDIKDSKGQTALQLAEKIESGRAREVILAALK